MLDPDAASSTWSANMSSAGAKKSASFADTIFQLYMRSFHMRSFDDHITEMVGLNLAGIRESAAMRLISQEMMLVAIAITLIVIVTLLYLRSIFISMVVNLGVGMSVGVAFFAYRIVFGWELFPFINMMAVFLLIGIACDNVYVLFDSWYAEKARVIAEDLPDMMKRQWLTSQSVVSMRPVASNLNDLTDSNGQQNETAATDNNNENESTSSDAGQNVKVVLAKTASDQLLPPIYVKRKKLWEKSRRKMSAEEDKSNEMDKVIHLFSFYFTFHHFI